MDHRPGAGSHRRKADLNGLATPERAKTLMFPADPVRARADGSEGKGIARPGAEPARAGERAARICVARWLRLCRAPGPAGSHAGVEAFRAPPCSSSGDSSRNNPQAAEILIFANPLAAVRLFRNSSAAPSSSLGRRWSNATASGVLDATYNRIIGPLYALTVTGAPGPRTGDLAGSRIRRWLRSRSRAGCRDAGAHRIAAGFNCLTVEMRAWTRWRQTRARALRRSTRSPIIGAPLGARLGASRRLARSGPWLPRTVAGARGAKNLMGRRHHAGAGAIGHRPGALAGRRQPYRNAIASCPPCWMRRSGASRSASTGCI
jgi:hypothetical protein